MLKRTNHLIIGTPGRITDMVKRRFLDLRKFEILVLDEFDRMLDMGFLPDVRNINSKMTNKSQTLLFSATEDASQHAIISGITESAVRIKAKANKPSLHSIEQEVIRIPSDKRKNQILEDLIIKQNGDKIILFCETRRKVMEVCKNLQIANIPTDMIHGDKSQRDREKALRKFKNGKVSVLVATDVVARGIDITNISLVINYEIPRNYNDYIHRIGRTGRAGKSGRAITLID
jgi:ATP-dependent RNA helicase RhlE